MNVCNPLSNSKNVNTVQQSYKHSSDEIELLFNSSEDGINNTHALTSDAAIITLHYMVNMVMNEILLLIKLHDINS